MNSKIVTHEIKDNQLRIENAEYIGLDLAKIIVGVKNPNEYEIVTNSRTGLNEARNRVEAQEIYNFKTKKHGFWFLLDLETGSRGWFPGCIIKGDVLGTDIPIKQSPNDNAETLGYISKGSLQILGIEAIEDDPEVDGWHKILYDIEGYIKKEYISNLRYIDPTRI
jgi:hypothetical protein